MNSIKKTMICLVILTGLCGSAFGATGFGLSNIFTIDNRFDFPVTSLEDDSVLGYVVYLCGSDADPVNTATGNFYHDEADFSVATRSVPLQFTRHYNSLDTRDGPLGMGWTHSYNISLTSGLGASGDRVSVRYGDGRTDYWIEDGVGGYDPNMPGLHDNLEFGGSSWTLTRKNLDVYSFDSSGELQTIADKNGNTFTLGYNISDQLTTITDPAGRAVTLTYNPDGTIETITDFAIPARTVQYGYTSGKLTQAMDVQGNTVAYTYDGNGYLETITDQRGIATVSNVYDVDGRVTQQADGKGNVTTFTYGMEGEFKKTTITYPDTTEADHLHSDNNLLLMIRYPQGSVHYAYDDDMNRTQIVDRNGNMTNFTYDPRGNVLTTTDSDDPCDLHDGGVTIVEYTDVRFPDLPTAKTDAMGNVTAWEYNANGNCTKETDPNGFETTWTYNSFGQKETATDKNSHTTTYTYDSNGLLTEVVNAESDHTWFGYDELWRLTQVTDGRGSAAADPDHTTTTVHDSTDRVTSVTGPITSQSYEYDEIGNRTKVINGRGFTTNYEYDDNSNLTEVERIVPSDPCQVIQYAYDQLNRKTSMTDPSGFVTDYEYDNLGRLIKETNPEDDETTCTYDPKGNVLTVTDGSGITTTYEYDSLNRKIGQIDELDNSWNWQYDKLGNLTTHTDAKGNITQYSYDTLNRLVSVTDALDDTTSFEYDNLGSLTQIKDGGNRIITRKFYNTANRLVRKEDGLANYYLYDYDGAGNLISITDPDSQTRTMVYDNENRLIEIHYPDTSQVVYTYDNNGNLLTMTDSTGTTTYTYDVLDRLISNTDSFGKLVEYGYDITGNRISIIYPADSINPARTVTYTYDTANRLDAITDWASRVWDYTLDGAGRITQLTYPNGIKRKQAFDDAGRLEELLYTDPADAEMIAYHYIRDELGNPTNVDETGTLQPDVSVLARKLQMDFDSDNRLTNANTDAYSYDNIGNVTSVDRGGQITSFTYNNEDRLTSQTTGASTVQHIYNGLNNRITRIDNGTEARYVLDYGRDMSHILCETGSSGDITAYYIHGPGIVGRIDAADTPRYYHTDPVGSVVALTDGSQTITDRYAYTPFGTQAGREGTTANPFTYVGGYGVMTEADDLYFMRARFYESLTGRFLSKDPVEGYLDNPSTLVKYPYASNNPLTYIDSGGKFLDIPLEILYGLADLTYKAVTGDLRTTDFVVFGASLAPDMGAITIMGIAADIEEGRGIAGDVFAFETIVESALISTIPISMTGFSIVEKRATIDDIDGIPANANRADILKALDSKSNNGRNVPAFYDPKLNVYHVNNKIKTIN